MLSVRGGDDELDGVRGERKAEAPNVGVNIWDNVLCLLQNSGCRHPGLKIATLVKAIVTNVCLLIYHFKFSVTFNPFKVS